MAFYGNKPSKIVTSYSTMTVLVAANGTGIAKGGVFHHYRIIEVHMFNYICQLNRYCPAAFGNTLLPAGLMSITVRKYLSCIILY